MTKPASNTTKANHFKLPMILVNNLRDVSIVPIIISIATKISVVTIGMGSVR